MTNEMDQLAKNDLFFLQRIQVFQAMVLLLNNNYNILHSNIQ